MRTRRIVASACALCLVVPAGAAAKPGGPVHVGHIRHAAAIRTIGDTKNDLHVRAYQQAAVTSTPSGVAGNESGNGWQMATLVEGGLLAAFAVGAAVTLSAGRRRHVQPTL